VKKVLTFVGFLEELERSHQTIIVPPEEVERLVQRFGSSVRQMGVWRHTTDGALELSTSEIAVAVRLVGDTVLTDALQQLRSPNELAGVLDRSGCAALRLIEELGRLHQEHFEQKVQRYQDTDDTEEAQALGEEILRELFGAWVPRIEWTSLPPGIRGHLLARTRERELSASDLSALLAWIKTDPEVPEGRWWKDFGSFKLAGEGRYPKTFLTAGQTAIGEKL
jgi:hypothetical protein